MSYSLTPDKFLTEDEYVSFITLLSRYSSPALIQTTEFRDSTLLRTALETGARAQEVLNISVKDFDFAHHRILIKGLKNSDNRLMPIPPDLFKNIRLLMEKNGGSRPFPEAYNTMRYIWTNWRPTQKKLHCLRHTFALRLYQRTRDILLVKQALGHRNLNNTMIYLNFTSQDNLFRILTPTPPQSPSVRS